MKVLMVNKFFYPVGGPETMASATSALLTADGHQVIEFAMQHPNNLPSKWSDYFVSNVDYKVGRYGPLRMASEAMRVIYSTEARRKIEALVTKTHPDLAHLHNIYHQISPSILPALKRAGIATVLTIHDGKLACPAEHSYVDGEICERCHGAKFYNCFTHRCIKNSRAKSLLCMVESYLHRITRIYERNIDVFIAPSEFYRKLLVNAGRARPEQVVTVFNGVDVEGVQSTAPGDYALYLGRVDVHKGVLTLVRAMAKCPSVRLKMVGQGDAVAQCEGLIRDLGIRNVELVGFQTGGALTELIKNSSFLVTPSEWYENCPMVIMEAAAYGKPAIVTDLGGMPELVDDGVTGFVVEPRSPEGLAARMDSLAGDRELNRRMGDSARLRAERDFTYKVHYSRLMEVYSRAVELSTSRR